MPAVLNVKLNCPPGPISGEFHAPPVSLDVCVVVSLFTHVTVVPTGTFVGFGEKAVVVSTDAPLTIDTLRAGPPCASNKPTTAKTSPVAARTAPPVRLNVMRVMCSLRTREANPLPSPATFSARALLDQRTRRLRNPAFHFSRRKRPRTCAPRSSPDSVWWVKLLKVQAIVALVGSMACTSAPPPEPALARPATIKDIMDSMVEPSADFLFDSVAQIADEHGITEKAPHSDEEWQEVKRRSIQLLEAPNLLVMKGRKVAPADDKSKNPEIELEPAQIQALIDADRLHFIERARVLQEAATLLVKASDARDKDALFQACNSLDKACENCHLKYWYPNDQRAQEAARKHP